jgi:hypothetical protein
MIHILGQHLDCLIRKAAPLLTFPWRAVDPYFKDATLAAILNERNRLISTVTVSSAS